MFIGHFGVAFAAKKVAPETSLGTLILAAQLLDFLWPFFLLLGIEHVRIAPGITRVSPLDFTDYPISHSLVAAIVWGVVAAALYYSWPTRDTTRHWQAAAIVGLAVFSHYPLDVLVHVPDLPIAGNDSPKLGLGLWNQPTATLIAELLVFGIGLAFYLTLKSHRHPVRVFRLAILVVVLVGTYLASSYGPLPPSMTVIAVSDIVFLVAVAALAAWADRRATPQELEAQRLSAR